MDQPALCALSPIAQARGVRSRPCPVSAERLRREIQDNVKALGPTIGALVPTRPGSRSRHRRQCHLIGDTPPPPTQTVSLRKEERPVRHPCKSMTEYET